jgi:hypothetical protein
MYVWAHAVGRKGERTHVLGGERYVLGTTLVPITMADFRKRERALHGQI